MARAGTEDVPPFLAGDGEMAVLMRRMDWSGNPLGVPAGWPRSLKGMVRMALTTQHPVFIFWGPRCICLYNDAYRASLGPERHPGTLGEPAAKAWPDIWPSVGPEVERVMSGARPTWHENELVPILRNGRQEEAFWTYSFGPIDDDSAPGGIGGVLVLCTETTTQVLQQRHHATGREQMAKLFALAPSFMAFLSGPKHTFELANPAFMQLVGDRALLGRTVGQSLPEAEAQGFTKLLDEVYATGRPYAATGAPLQLLQPDGRQVRRYVDFVYQPVTDAGVVTGIFVQGIDATDRHAVVDALAFNAEQLRLAIDAADIALWDLDLIAGTLFWPPRLKAMFGISDHADVGMDDFYAGLHPDDRAATAGAFSEALDPARRSVYEVEYRTIGREDGRVRWVAAKGRGIFDEAGRCVRAIGTAIDITGRKRTEAELRAFNARLEQRETASLAERNVLATIVEGATALVQVLDLDYRWLAINQACAADFRRVYGFVPQLGESLLEALTPYPEHLAQVRRFWDRALGGEVFSATAEFRLPGREPIHYEFHFNTLHDLAGERIGAYQFVYDVTQRILDKENLAKAEASLLQARKMEAIGQLTGGLAHDFNNLLQAVQGNLELIRRLAPGNEKVVRFAEKGIDATRRGAKLTAQLLTFSKDQAPELRSVSLKDLFDGLEDLVKTTLGPTHRLTIDCPASHLAVFADPTQLEMALLNLALNARDAMPEGGEFRLVASARNVVDEPGLAPGSYVDIVAQDTGPGMSPEVLVRAFDPFFTTKAIGKGSGLGLSQVYGMASRAGGHASLKSDPGAGVSVIMTLRRSESLGLRIEAEDSAPGASPTPATTVLVVDDDDNVRQFITDALMALGYTTLEASGGPPGLELFRSRKVDAVVVDFAMPGMNGAEVVRAIRRLDADVPVVMASGYADSAAVDAATDGDIVMLRKPFDISALQRCLEDAMGMSPAAGNA